MFLIRPKTICEFLKIETKICHRKLHKNYQVGFFTEPTHSALVARNAFTPFFDEKNLEKLYIPIYNSADKIMDKYEKEWKLNNQEWKSVDIAPLLEEMLYNFSY